MKLLRVSAMLRPCTCIFLAAMLLFCSGCGKRIQISDLHWSSKNGYCEVSFKALNSGKTVLSSIYTIYVYGLIDPTIRGDSYTGLLGKKELEISLNSGHLRDFKEHIPAAGNKITRVEIKPNPDN